VVDDVYLISLIFNNVLQVNNVLRASVKPLYVCIFLSSCIFLIKKFLIVFTDINFEGKEETALGNKYRLSVSSPSS
jgi:hypothetical protein